MVALATQAQSDPIGWGTWHRYLATVRTFADRLMARGELTLAFNDAIDGWIGPRRVRAPDMATLSDAYS